MTDDASVLGRALSIVDAFAPGEPSLSLAELARRTGLPKSTAHRFVTQLETLKVLERDGPRIRLGLRLFEWGSLVPRQRTMRDAALPFMEDLYEATHETVHLGLLEDLEVVYVNKISGHQRTHVPTSVGSRMPAHCTGLGKAILAFSPEADVEATIARGLPAVTPSTIVSPELFRAELAAARRDGVAYDRAESAAAVACVAAPIRNTSGRAIAAISVTGPPPRIDVERLSPVVRFAALGLSRAMRGRS